MTKQKILKDSRVIDVYQDEEDNSWWIDLSVGFCHKIDQTSSIHEKTLKEAFNKLQGVVPCDNNNNPI